MLTRTEAEDVPLAKKKKKGADMLLSEKSWEAEKKEKTPRKKADRAPLPVSMEGVNDRAAEIKTVGGMSTPVSRSV